MGIEDTALSGRQFQSDQPLSAHEERDFSGSVLACRAFQSFAIPLHIIDAENYQVILANDAAQRLGIHSGSTCYSQTHGRSSPCIEEHACPLQEAKASKTLVSARHIHKDAQGKPRIFDVFCFLLLDPTGHVTHVVEYGIDVTDRCQAEEVRLASEKRFRTLFEAVGDAVVLLDHEKVYDCNMAAVRVFGFADLSELIGHSPLDLSPPFQPDGRESAAAAHEHMARAFDKGRWRFEWVHRRAGGREFPAEVLLSAIELDGRRVLHAVILDITARRRSEDEIVSLKQQMEFILGATKTGLDIIDTDFNIRYVDPEWQKILGDRTGRKCFQYFMGRDDVCPGCGIIKALETKSVAVSEEVLTRENNRVVQVTTIPYQDRNGEWLVAEVNADITERRKVETALRESEERYRIVAEQTGQLIYDYDLGTGRIVWSGAISTLTGYSAEEFREVDIDRWAEMIHPEDRGRALKALETARKGTTPYYCEYRFRRSNGTYWYFEDNGSSVRDNAGKVVRILGTMQDVTGRRLAERAQERSRQYLQNIINTIGDPVFVKDEQHCLSLINDAFCALVGRPREEIVGKADQELYPEDRARVFQEHDGRVFASMLVDENEETITGASGDIHIISTKKAAFVDPVSGGRVLVGVIRDVTERKRAEAALRESEELHRTLYESSRDAIMQLSPEEGFLAGNPAAVALFGCRDEAEFKTYNPVDLSPEYQPDGIESEVKARNMMMLALAEGSHFFEWTHKRVDGSIFPATVLLTRMTIGGKTLLQATVRNITERQRAEQALRESEERFRTVIDSARDAIVVMGPQGEISLWSPGAEATFGWTADEAVGKMVHRLLTPARLWEAHAKAFPAFQASGQGAAVGKTLELPALHKDGHEFPVELSLSALELNGRWQAVGILRDITKRRLAEQAQERSQQYLQNIINTISDPVFVKDEQRRLLQVNDAYCSLIGRWRQDIVGKTDDELFPKEQARAFWECDDLVFASMRPCQSEEPITDALGTTHVISTKKAAFSDPTSGDKTLVGVIHDITERKRMEEEIAYRLRIEEATASASSLVQNPTSAKMDELLKILGQAIEVNRAYIFRFSDHQRKMSSIHEWCERGKFPQINNLQDMNTAALPWALATLLRGEPVVIDHVDDLPPEAAGERALFQNLKIDSILLVPIFSASGELTGFIGFDQEKGRRHWRHENVSALQVVGEMIGTGWDRQLAEETLKQTVDRFTAMINTVPALMYIKDAGHRYTVVNEAFCRAAKRSSNGVVGYTDPELFPPEPANWLYETGKMVMDSGRAAINQEEHIDLGDGIVRWLAATVVPLPDDSGMTSGVVGMVQDVTEGHMSRDQLIQADKLAAIGTLAAGVAHEINNPMGFISSNLNTMSKYLKKIETFVTAPPENQEAEQKKFSEMLTDFADAIAESLEGANRVKKIVADLKSFSRIDRAEKEMTNLNEGLESTLNIVWNEIKYNCEVEKNYGDIPDLYCIPNQINQVFLNLLVNAGQAITNPPGKIFITTWADDKNIYVSIKDTGCGIPEENLAKIFEPFFTTKEVGKGTGLGLGLAYDIVKKHGGQIAVTSKVGVGSEFIISLPREGYNG